MDSDKWSSCIDSSTISLEDTEKTFLDRDYDSFVFSISYLDNSFFIIQSNVKEIIRIITRD